MSSGAIIRTFDAVVDDVNMEKRSVVARINTSNVDRYNTVILARGGTIGRWKKAGAPVLWEHGKDPRRHTDPIANSPRVWNNGGPNPTEWIAEPIFIGDDFAQQRFEWYRDDKIRGWSVNILPNPRSASPPTQEELRSRPDWEGAELIYREWDLAEFSGTVVPGNADALTSDRAIEVMQLVERSGLWLPDEARAIYEAAKDRNPYRPPPGTFEIGRTDDIVARYITHDKESGKWIVHAESGKVLGEHDSKESAEKQLAAIEAHKHDEERALPDLTGARSLVEIARELTSERRTLQQSLRDEVIAMIDLLVYGRV